MKFIPMLCLCIASIIFCSNFCMTRQLIRDENGFRIRAGQHEQVVRPCFVDPLLRRMNTEQLERFIKQGNRIRAIRLSDGEHRLQAMVPGKGGGPIGFALGYGMTKALCWSGLIGAGVGAAVVTGGAVLGVSGVGAAAVSVGAAQTVAGLAGSASAMAGAAGVAGAGAAAGAVGVGAAAGFTAGATAATAVGTAAATGAVLTGGAAVAAASAPAVVGTVVATGGLVASIEAASLCVGTWIGVLTGPF